MLGELNEESYLYHFTSNPFCGIRLCGKQFAPEMKSLANFETNDQHYDLQGIEHSFAKVLNFKTNRKDITAKTILKFVYPKKTDKEFNNASVSIKDCIRYATSIGVNMEWLDATKNELNFNQVKSELDKDHPVLLCYKPNKTDWMEPYLLAVAHGYVYVAPDGENIKEPFMSTSIWMSNYIYPSSLTTLTNKNKLTVTDFSVNNTPQKDYTFIGMIILK